MFSHLPLVGCRRNFDVIFFSGEVSVRGDELQLDDFISRKWYEIVTMVSSG